MPNYGRLGPCSPLSVPGSLQAVLDRSALQRPLLVLPPQMPPKAAAPPHAVSAAPLLAAAADAGSLQPCA